MNALTNTKTTALTTTTGYTLEHVYTGAHGTTYRCTHYKGMRLALDMQDHITLFDGASCFNCAGDNHQCLWAGLPVDHPLVTNEEEEENTENQEIIALCDETLKLAPRFEQAFINRCVLALDSAPMGEHGVYVYWFRIGYGEWMDAEEVVNAGGLPDYLESLGLSSADVAELMVQDWDVQDAEGLASRCIGNYGSFDWALMSELLSVSVPAEVLSAGLACGIDPEAIEEAYMGEWEDDEAMAYDQWEQGGMLESIPEAARGYIDWEMVARDMMFSGVTAANGHYFMAA